MTSFYCQCINVYLNFFTLINRMEMWWWVVAVIHTDDNSIETTEFRHGTI